MAWWKRVLGRSRHAIRDPDASLREALLAVLDRDYERAEALLVPVVQQDTTTIEPYLALARLYRARGEIGRAIHMHQNLLLRTDLSKAQTAAALADLAADFRQGGFLQRAIASYDELLQHDPRHPEALRALVPLLASVRDYPRAIETARRLARVEGGEVRETEAQLWVQLAEAATAEGRSDDARRALKRALRKHSGSAAGWLALGQLEAERGRTRAALSAWQRVARLDRRLGARVYPQLEATYAALDRARDFEGYLRELIEERPEDVHARIALARALCARGETDEGVRELRELIEQRPDDVEGRAALVRTLVAAQRESEASAASLDLVDALERNGLLREPEKLV